MTRKFPLNALDHLTDRQLAAARHLLTIRNEGAVRAYLAGLGVLTDREVGEAILLLVAEEGPR